MRKLKLFFASLVASLISLSATAGATSYKNNTPDVYLVMYSADWCSFCRIVEPRIDEALRRLNDDAIEYVMFDISNRDLQMISAHKAFDREIVKQYNQYFMATGFAAIIDADTKQTLGCVTSEYQVEDMVEHIKNLKTHAVANSTVFNATCPQPVRPA